MWCYGALTNRKTAPPPGLMRVQRHAPPVCLAPQSHSSCLHTFPVIQAAAIQWPEVFGTAAAEARKDELVEKMRAVRPVVETGWVGPSYGFWGVYYTSGAHTSMDTPTSNPHDEHSHLALCSWQVLATRANEHVGNKSCPPMPTCLWPRCACAADMRTSCRSAACTRA